MSKRDKLAEEFADFYDASDIDVMNEFLVADFILFRKEQKKLAKSRARTRRLEELEEELKKLQFKLVRLEEMGIRYA